MKKSKWKKVVKEAIRKLIEKELRKDMEKLQKTDTIKEDKFEMKAYVHGSCVEDARTHFRIRTNMINVKMNFKSDPKYSRELWRCDGCRRTVESQPHILYCPAYKTLREGRDIKDDNDLVKYVQEVLLAREKGRQGN